MRARLRQAQGVTAAAALAAVDSVYGGIEVIDSTAGTGLPVHAADVVADNASSGCAVTGPVARAARPRSTCPWKRACWS